MMLPQPILKPMPDSGETMLVQSPLVITLPIVGRILTVLPGFVTDGTSIPDAFWTVTGVAPFDPDFLAASLPHDALYGAELLPREQCDDVFEALLMANSVRSKTHATLFFEAVRIGGASVWSQHTPESIAAARQYCSLTWPCSQGR
jgi:hypothetical protein